MSRAKIIELIKLKKAIDKKEEAFVLYNKLEELKERIDNMKPTDLFDTKKQLESIEKKINEEIEVELIIE